MASRDWSPGNTAALGVGQRMGILCGSPLGPPPQVTENMVSVSGSCEEQIQRANRAVEGLFETLAFLERRLETALSSPTPIAEKNTGNQSDLPSLACSLANRIASISGGVEEAILRLNYLRERIDL